MDADDNGFTLTPRPWLEAASVHEWICEAYRGGMIQREIAREVGYSQSFVSQVLTSYGITRRDRPLERTQDIVRRLSAGETLRSLGEHYGISRERVRQLAAREGWTGKDAQTIRTLRTAEERDRRRWLRQAPVRARRRAERRRIVETLRALAQTLGRTPIMDELAAAVDYAPSGIFEKFVPRYRRRPYGRIGYARLCRAAGVELRPVGGTGQRKKE